MTLRVRRIVGVRRGLAAGLGQATPPAITLSVVAVQLLFFVQGQLPVRVDLRPAPPRLGRRSGPGPAARRSPSSRACWSRRSVIPAPGRLVLVDGGHLADLLPCLVIGGCPGQVPRTGGSRRGLAAGISAIMRTGRTPPDLSAPPGQSHGLPLPLRIPAHVWRAALTYGSGVAADRPSMGDARGRGSSRARGRSPTRPGTGHLLLPRHGGRGYGQAI